jgi:hypothetical protein
MLARFWNQENRTYRNMQIVFTLLTLNFIIPSLSYFFAPRVAYQSFLAIGRAMGAGEYPFPEEGHLWRVLAFGNVFTLGTLTFLMQWNLRKWHVLVPVFTVLKSCSALGYLYVWLVELPYPVFLGVFFFDSLAVFLVVWFGGSAYRSLGPPGPADQRLVPAIGPAA